MTQDMPTYYDWIADAQTPEEFAWILFDFAHELKDETICIPADFVKFLKKQVPDNWADRCSVAKGLHLGNVILDED